jgi:predicted ATPase
VSAVSALLALERRRQFWTDEQWEQIVYEAKKERTNRPWSDRAALSRANKAAMRLRRIAAIAEHATDLHGVQWRVFLGERTRS